MLAAATVANLLTEDTNHLRGTLPQRSAAVEDLEVVTMTELQSVATIAIVALAVAKK